MKFIELKYSCLYSFRLIELLLVKYEFFNDRMCRVNFCLKFIMFVPFQGIQKVFVQVWGCSHNTSDAEYMAGLLSSYGYQVTLGGAEKDTFEQQVRGDTCASENVEPTTVYYPPFMLLNQRSKIINNMFNVFLRMALNPEMVTVEHATAKKQRGVIKIRKEKKGIQNRRLPKKRRMYGFSIVAL